MTFVITEPCEGVCDASCVEVCPVDCIHGPISVDEIQSLQAAGEEAQLAGIQLYIDPDICIDCGACEPECPVEAIFEEWDVPEEWSDYTLKNAEFFQ
ncbi:4Fe-4S dicluster domain-containing protein [Bradymonas sediminis]|uniref:Ferredoxin n=1 Tax=Bradymonas sediminis TaxID=1548548 RepID=A0A2Z4FNS6_9DELT|nr:ferredoxin family protein [Bradymonas sediminis]AWV90530.1 ferredoxin [Bradymonas sediminis]TDP72077.1 NAD-dependent dihydropyrimidine dehydrogenase PreA subunit [Bradymonas sediminis]